MVKQIEAGGLKCDCVSYPDIGKVTYTIYPDILPLANDWLCEMSSRYQTPLVVIYIPRDNWNDMLTPWPETGETPDSPPFAGNAAATLSLIREKVIPAAEQALGIPNGADRNLIGVSLSGLFALWQWLECDTFKSIASLSGSFWYNGFIEWFGKQPIPPKTGKAYFLLGEKEPYAWIKAYRSVGINTETIVERLKKSDIRTIFQWVSGNHFSDPLGRMEDALKSIC